MGYLDIWAFSPMFSFTRCAMKWQHRLCYQLADEHLLFPGLKTLRICSFSFHFEAQALQGHSAHAHFSSLSITRLHHNLRNRKQEQRHTVSLTEKCFCDSHNSMLQPKSKPRLILLSVDWSRYLLHFECTPSIHPFSLSYPGRGCRGQQAKQRSLPL